MKRLFITIAVSLVAVSSLRAQKLTGAGATFPFPIYSKWFSEYSAAHPGVRIEYRAIGSGGGIRAVSAGVVDFGASDEPLTDYQMAASRVKIVQIPAVVGAVVPIYNLPGVTGLRFSPEALAGIYLGRIRKWNDTQIAADNPGVTLPDLKIHVVYRSDGSGTSYIFTDYLSKVSKEWAGGPGRSILPAWPVGSGAKGSEAVSAQVRRVAGSVGYVELTYALKNGVTAGIVRNASGNWIGATVESVAEAAGAIKQLPADYRISITDAPGPNAYPIASFTWLLVPLRSMDAAKGNALKELLGWVETEGQSQATALSYAPLPDAVTERVLKTISALR